MEPEMMPMAAKGKHRLMILCALFRRVSRISTG